ncbi:hypothetical protein [Acetobacter sp. UBA5411]|uniref:hypothetical protein n=1 Tax=Acetobacter sp. UBA5411 TaxID=1945905 RepID=UPI0025BE7DCD|nr:hypothetical protein [Acetobacter sp. UBA5411]
MRKIITALSALLLCGSLTACQQGSDAVVVSFSGPLQDRPDRCWFLHNQTIEAEKDGTIEWHSPRLFGTSVETHIRTRTEHMIDNSLDGGQIDFVGAAKDLGFPDPSKCRDVR